MPKKRNRSVFDAIQELESEDAKTETHHEKSRKNQHRQAQAAQAQTKIYSAIAESRILLQRAVTSSIDENDVEDQCNSLLGSLLKSRQQLVSGNTSENNDSYSDLIKENDLDDIIQEEYEACRQEWKIVLNKRHNDLKLHSGVTAKSQFRVLDSSFWEQVEGTVEYESMQKDKEFDDSKVYQQLLKDFVATSASSQSQKSIQRKVQQNKKKQVDRRASKGRKIRYREIPKLVNFTFPLSRNTTNSAGLGQDEWFRSLFGGVGKRS
jgi:hypothetical protein